MKTRAGTVGGGPSGRLLSQLLHLQGISTVVLERHSRDHVRGRIRAGVLEQGVTALMRQAQVAGRMDRGGDTVHRVDCDYVVGSDGFHGVSRKSIPRDRIAKIEGVDPFGWLGVLSRIKPVSPELVCARHARGFASCSLRSQVLSH